MQLLSELQIWDPRSVRTALLTRRTSPAQEPVLKALREANVRLDEAFFGSDLPRDPLIELFGPQLVFGDGGTHFRVADEIARADLQAIEDEEKKSQEAHARLQQRASRSRANSGRAPRRLDQPACFGSKDVQEGLAAARERRPAKFEVR